MITRTRVGAYHGQRFVEQKLAMDVNNPGCFDGSFRNSHLSFSSPSLERHVWLVPDLPDAHRWRPSDHTTPAILSRPKSSTGMPSLSQRTS